MNHFFQLLTGCLSIMFYWKNHKKKKFDASRRKKMVERFKKIKINKLPKTGRFSVNFAEISPHHLMKSFCFTFRHSNRRKILNWGCLRKYYSLDIFVKRPQVWGVLFQAPEVIFEFGSQTPLVIMMWKFSY